MFCASRRGAGYANWIIILFWTRMLIWEQATRSRQNTKYTKQKNTKSNVKCIKQKNAKSNVPIHENVKINPSIVLNVKRPLTPTHCQQSPTRWVVFSGHRPKRFWNDRKKLNHFGHVWKYGLKNTVMVSFNTTVRQMTEMFQRPKCLSKNDRNVSAKKNQTPRIIQSETKNNYSTQTEWQERLRTCTTDSTQMHILHQPRKGSSWRLTEVAAKFGFQCKRLGLH